MYCSGDLHSGSNVSRWWKMSLNPTVTHMGVPNMLGVLGWVEKNIQLDQLPEVTVTSFQRMSLHSFGGVGYMQTMMCVMTFVAQVKAAAEKVCVPACSFLLPPHSVSPQFLAASLQK